MSWTAEIIYSLLLYRAQLSKKNRWIDSEGRIYIQFSNASLAKALHKCEASVRNALRELEKAGLIEKRSNAGSANAYRLATRYPVMVRAALGLPDINYTPGFNPDVDLDTDSISSMLPNYFGLLKPLHEEDGCDPSEGVVLLFHDKPNAKEPSAELKIVPMVNAEGVPVLSVRVSDLPQQ